VPPRSFKIEIHAYRCVVVTSRPPGCRIERQLENGTAIALTLLHTSGREQMRPVIGFLTISMLTAGVDAASAQARLPPTARRSQLRAVRIRPARDGVQVVFVLDGRPAYKSTRSAQPPRITIDILQTAISPLLTHREYLSEHAALVRVLLVRSSGATRAVLDLAAAGPHTIYCPPGANQIVVDIRNAARNAATLPRSTPRSAAAPSKPATATVVSPPAPIAHPDAAPSPAAISGIERRGERASATIRIPWVPRGPEMTDFTADWSLPDGVRVNGFRQREPADGTPVSEGTIAYLSYDSDNLYAAFVCHDEPGRVRTHLTPREDIGGDDQVAVYLDTFRDGRHAYVFASNPSGVQQDGVIDEGDDASYELDTLWYSQGRLTRDGYAVLIAIPFKSVRFSSAPVQEWRIALGRTIARHGETAFWPYITAHGRGFVPQMGALEGLELISPGHNLQFIPYGTFFQAQSPTAGASGAVTTESRRIGLDAKAVVRNAVTIDATVNPDFSEVESNEPQVAVNQRFELFLPEKRPFFLENAAMFATPIDVFFSRRISNPEFGVKMTARSTGWLVGAIAADDRAVDAADAGGWLGAKAAIGVVRALRSFADRGKVAVLATERQTGSNDNRVVSVDARANLSPSWSVSGQALSSDDVDRSGTHQGAGYFAGILRSGSHFNYIGSYRDLGASLRVPLGYVPRVDIRVTEHYASYVWRPGDSGVWAFGPSVSAAADWDHAGTLQDRWATGDLALFVAGQIEAHAARSESYELYAATKFRKAVNSVSFSTSTPGWVSLWASYSWGTGIDYSPPAGVLPFLGASQGAYASLTLRPTSRLRLEEMYLHERLQTLPGVSIMAGQPIFTTHIVRSKANLQMTRALAVRGILDYNELASNPLRFSDPSARRVTGDVLLTYLLHPGTALYLGFNDSYEDADPEPRRGIRLPTVPAGRQVFAKVSYLLRF
jgi:hypothetical protein